MDPSIKRVVSFIHYATDPLNATDEEKKEYDKFSFFKILNYGKDEKTQAINLANKEVTKLLESLPKYRTLWWQKLIDTIRSLLPGTSKPSYTQIRKKIQLIASILNETSHHFPPSPTLDDLKAKIRLIIPEAFRIETEESIKQKLSTKEDLFSAMKTTQRLKPKLNTVYNFTPKEVLSEKATNLPKTSPPKTDIDSTLPIEKEPLLSQGIPSSQVDSTPEEVPQEESPLKTKESVAKDSPKLNIDLPQPIEKEPLLAQEDPSLETSVSNMFTKKDISIPSTIPSKLKDSLEKLKINIAATKQCVKDYHSVMENTSVDARILLQTYADNQDDSLLTEENKFYYDEIQEHEKNNEPSDQEKLELNEKLKKLQKSIKHEFKSFSIEKSSSGMDDRFEECINLAKNDSLKALKEIKDFERDLFQFRERLNYALETFTHQSLESAIQKPWDQVFTFFYNPTNLNETDLYSIESADELENEKEKFYRILQKNISKSSEELFESVGEEVLATLVKWQMESQVALINKLKEEYDSLKSSALNPNTSLRDTINAFRDVQQKIIEIQKLIKSKP